MEFLLFSFKALQDMNIVICEIQNLMTVPQVILLIGVQIRPIVSAQKYPSLSRVFHKNTKLTTLALVTFHLNADQTKRSIIFNKQLELKLLRNTAEVVKH